MTEGFHPSEWDAYRDSYYSSLVSTWTSLGLSFTVAGFLAVANVPWQKASLSGLGLATSAIGLCQNRTHQKMKRRLAMVENASDLGFGEYLIQKLAPISERITAPVVEEQKEFTLFDWSRLLTDPDEFPHLLLLGKTGAGKSWLGERLLTFLGGTQRVITPHRKPSDFVGFEVIGAGRNYKAIAVALKNLEDEMQRRYERYTTGDEGYPFLNVVIDEFPAIAANCSIASEIIKTLAREARKVKIRILLLSQGDEVRALGIEGEGSLRECFTFVRLKGFAEKHAKSLKDKTLQQWLKQFKHPCLVEDNPAITSDLLKVSAPIQSALIASSTPIQPSIQPESELNQFSDNSDLIQALNRLWENSPSDSESNEFKGQKQPETDDEMRSKIAELKGQGLSQNQIIFVIWKAKPGGNKAYQNAVAEYKRLMSE